MSEGTSESSSDATGRAGRPVVAQESDPHAGAPIGWPARVRLWVTAFCGRAVLAIQVVVLAILAGISIVSTVRWTPADRHPHDSLLHETAPLGLQLPSLAFFCGLLLFPPILVLAGLLICKMRRRGRLFLLVSFLLLAQCVWIVSLNGTRPWYPDSLMVSRGAQAWLARDWKSFSFGYCSAKQQAQCLAKDPMRRGNLNQYLSWYPFQSGSMLWFLLIFRIFGSGNFLAIQFVNAVCISLAALLICLLAERAGLDDRGTGILVVLMITCLPMVMYSSFIYANAGGFMFAILAMYLLSAALCLHGILSIILATAAFLSGGVAVVVKSTFNILLIAIVLTALIVCIRLRRYLLALWSTVCFAGAWKAASLPLALLQRLSGEDFGRGLPASSWIAIGLGRSKSGMPGWWHPEALDNYFTTGNDYEAMNDMAKRAIADRLGQYLGDPGRGLGFFGGKLMSEWSDPTFQTGFYAAQFDHGYHFDSGLAFHLLTEPMRSSVLSYDDVMQSVIYLFALVGLVSCLKGKPVRNGGRIGAVLMLSLGFLGGFACYLFWEAKSVYALPFYLLLLPFAAQGLSASARRLSGPAARFRFLPGRAGRVGRVKKEPKPVW